MVIIFLTFTAFTRVVFFITYTLFNPVFDLALVTLVPILFNGFLSL